MILHKFHLVVFCAASVAAVAVISRPARAAVKVNTSLTPDEAREHAQETNTVCGVVTTTKFLTTKSKLTFIDLGRPYPNQPFAAVIPAAARGKFKRPPEEFYRGKTICVTGLIVIIRDKPQIVVDDPSQIQIQEAPAANIDPTPATPAAP
jgi:hypothetical protein